MKSPRLSTLGKLLGCAILLGAGFVLVPNTVTSAPEATIAPQDLVMRLEMPQAPLILDVRSPAEYADGHIPGAMNFPYRDLPNRIDELLPFRSREIILYCEVGVRARIAEVVLAQAGFEHLVHLQGDMQRWRQEGFPIHSETMSPAN